MDVYERVKKTKVPRSMALTSMPYQGRVLKGVILDETHGRPAGTIALYSEDTRYVRKDGFGFVCLVTVHLYVESKFM